MTDRDRIEQRLTTLLRPARIPPAEELRARVRARLPGPRRGPARARAALAAVALLALTATAAVAGSADLRDHLRAAVTLTMGRGGALSVRPAPAFTFLQPSDLSPGWWFVGQGYIAGPGSGSGYGGGVFRRDDPPDSAVAAAARRRTAELLDRAGDEPTLVLIYGARPDQFVELVEHPAAGRTLPAGERTTVRGRPAVRRARDGRDVYVWTEGDTWVELATTLGDAEARRFLGGLRPAATVAGVPGQGAPAADAEHKVVKRIEVPPPIPRTARVERVAVDAPAIQARCGAWRPDLYPTMRRSATQQTLCVAQAVAGVDPYDPANRDNPYGAGVGPEPWSTAASRFGLDPASGPAGDAPVWVVSLDRADGTGAVVVLDMGTGRPYALVRLTPASPGA